MSGSPASLVVGLGVDTLSLLRHESALDGDRVLVVVERRDDLSEAARAEGERLGLELVTFDEIERSEGILAWAAGRGVHRIVRSPGFPRSHRALAKLIDTGIPVTTSVGLWLGRYGGSYRTVAITGTKGKSTATSLLASALRSLGATPTVAGNIGVPIWDATTDLEADSVVVIEVSSYMAADIGSSPSVGVLTSLGEDHVSWHGSVDAYQRDKLSLFTHANPDNGQRCPVVVPAEEGAAIAALAALGVDVRVVDSGDQRFDLARGLMTAAGTPEHVLRNLACAVLAAETVTGRKMDSVAVADVMRSYEPLPSRHRTIARVGGIRWVDDALASNPLAAAAAVLALPEDEIALILGGTARGVDVSPLREAILRRGPRRLALVGLPDNGEELLASLGAQEASAGEWGRTSVAGLADTLVETICVDRVADAVSLVATRYSSGACVFAPAAPTPPRSGSYVDRAREFAEAVSQLERDNG